VMRVLKMTSIQCEVFDVFREKGSKHCDLKDATDGSSDVGLRSRRVLIAFQNIDSIYHDRNYEIKEYL